MSHFTCTYIQISFLIFCFLFVVSSFVRSVTMDKWKDAELEKMRVGGNKISKEFMKDQSDYNPSWTFKEKYNSRAAALLRDKVI